MIFQIDELSIPKSVSDFLQTEGIVWDVIPGVGLLEKEINSLEDLYSFMEQCELLSNIPLSFNMIPLSSIVDKNRGIITHIDKNEKPMIYLTITDGRWKNEH